MRKRDELKNGCMDKAGNQEMTFVLLSRDCCSPATIRFWVRERIKRGKNKLEDPQILEALQCALTMEEEGRNYPKSYEEKVLAVKPGASLWGGRHGKVWVQESFTGVVLSDVMCSGTASHRAHNAWKQAAERLGL